MGDWTITVTEPVGRRRGVPVDVRPGVEIWRGDPADSAGPWLRSWDEVEEFLGDLCAAALDAFGEKEES